MLLFANVKSCSLALVNVSVVNCQSHYGTSEEFNSRYLHFGVVVSRSLNGMCLKTWTWNWPMHARCLFFSKRCHGGLRLATFTQNAISTFSSFHAKPKNASNEAGGFQLRGPTAELNMSWQGCWFMRGELMLNRVILLRYFKWQAIFNVLVQANVNKNWQRSQANAWVSCCPTDTLLLHFTFHPKD